MKILTIHDNFNQQMSKGAKQIVSKRSSNNWDCFTSFTTRKTNTQTALRIPLTSVRIAISIKQNPTDICKGVIYLVGM